VILYLPLPSNGALRKIAVNGNRCQRRIDVLI
jgi:hypothetical protein